MFDAFASPLKKCGTMKMSSPVVALDLLVGLRDDPPLLPCAEAEHNDALRRDILIILATSIRSARLPAVVRSLFLIKKKLYLYPTTAT